MIYRICASEPFLFSDAPSSRAPGINSIESQFGCANRTVTELDIRLPSLHAAVARFDDNLVVQDLNDLSVGLGSVVALRCSATGPFAIFADFNDFSSLFKTCPFSWS